MAKPKFDPSKPFEPVAEGSKPKFDPGKPFEPAAARDPSLPGLPGEAPNPKTKPFEDAEEGFLDEAGRIVKSVAGPAIKGLASTGENIVSGITGTAGSLANLTNALTGAKELPGMKGKGESDADFYRRTREQSAYQPRTEGGQELANSAPVQAVSHVVEQGGKGFEKLTGSEAAGELFKDAFAVGTAAAPLARPKGPVRVRPEIDPRDVVAPAEATPSKRITNNGWSIRPSDKNKVELGQKTSTLKEKVTGSTQVGRDLLPKNQRNTMKTAARDLGLPDDTASLTPEIYDSLRVPEVAVYDQTGKAAGKFTATPELQAVIDGISKKPGLMARKRIAKELERYANPELDGPTTVKTISELRRTSSRQLRSDNPVANEFGMANRAVADALEAQLEGRLIELGDSAGLANFRAARTRLAKIHDYEAVTKGGLVDAIGMYKLGKKAPLSGGAKEIAYAAEHAPEVMRHPQAVKGTGENPLQADTLYGAGKQAVQGGLRKLIGGTVPLKGSETGYRPSTPPIATTPKPPSLPPVPEAVQKAMAIKKLGGDDLSLLDDMAPQDVMPEAPSRLQAETPPAVRGDIDFEATNLADSPLDFMADDFAPGIPGGQAPRAAGMAQDVPGMTLHPELKAVRGRPDEVVGDLALADDIEGPHNPPGFDTDGGAGGVPPSGGNPGFDMAADLGIEIAPSAKRPGQFEITINGEGGGASFSSAQEARAAALDIADSLIGGEPEAPVAAAPKAGPANPLGGPADMFDDLFTESAQQPPLKLFRGGRSENSAITPDHFADDMLGKSSGHPSAGLGVFFTESADDAARYGNVSSHDVALKNPKVLKSADVPEFETTADAKKYRDQLVKAGHDGIMLDFSDVGGPKQYVAFDHAAVKKAVGE